MDEATKKRSYTTGAREKVAGARSLLGVLSDQEVAARLGVSRSSVADYRRAEGIQAAPRSARLTPELLARIKPSKVAAQHDVVGHLTDSAVAQLAGVSSQTVQAYRKRYGIPAARARSAPADTEAAEVLEVEETAEVEEAAEVAEVHEAAPLEAVGGQVVWRVLGTRERLFVVASTMAEAAAKVDAAGYRVGLKRAGIVLA